MEDNKLICPFKRIDTTNMDLKVDLAEDKMNIKVEVTTKNPIKSFINFINSKFGGNDNE